MAVLPRNFISAGGRSQSLPQPTTAPLRTRRSSKRAGSYDRLATACLNADFNSASQLLVADPRLLESMPATQRELPAQAAAEDRLDSVRLMALLGFRLDWEGPDGGAPLHYAAWRGNPALVKLLLEMGAPVNQRDRATGCSPLGWAAHGSRYCEAASEDEYRAVVEVLLHAGANRENAINTWGETPEETASPGVAATLRAYGFALI
jgi:ankyrin repeat protein